MVRLMCHFVRSMFSKEELDRVKGRIVTENVELQAERGASNRSANNERSAKNN